MLAGTPGPRPLPKAVTCPDCEQPMRASDVTAAPDQPVAVTYVCDTIDCGTHQFVVQAL